MTFLPKHKGIICDDGIVEEVRTIDRIILDEQPADNGSKKTQYEWIDYWNGINDGRVMASMGDLYLVFKQLKEKYEKSSVADKYKVKQVLNGLRDDLDWPGKNNSLMANTRILYIDKNNATILNPQYNYNTQTFQEFTKNKTIEVPFFRIAPISQVINDPKGLAYLQTLFDTSDDGETIIQTLEFISGKNKYDIAISTEERDNRHSSFGSLVGVNYYGRFLVVGEYDIDVKGRSRGILINKNS